MHRVIVESPHRERFNTRISVALRDMVSEHAGDALMVDLGVLSGLF